MVEERKSDKGHKHPFDPTLGITAKLQRAVACHQVGRLAEAEQLYQQVLAGDFLTKHAP